MASWDTPAVAAPPTSAYAPPVQDFSAFGNLLTDFVKGRQEGREEDKANLFRNGIPRTNGGTETGPIDFDKTLNAAAKVGGLEYAKPLMDLQMGSQIGQGAASAITGGATSPPTPGAPSAPAPYGAPQPSPPVRTPLPTAGPAQPGASPAPQQATIRQVLAAQGIPNDQLDAAAASVARQLGMEDDKAPIDTKDPQVANVLMPAIGQLKRSGIGQVVSGSQPQPQAGAAPDQPAPAAPNQRVAQTFDDVPASARQDMSDATQIRARAAQYAAIGQKGAAETLNKEADAREARAKQSIDAASAAPAIKEWRQSGSPLPYDEWVAQAEGSKETAKEDAKLSATKYATLVENGTKAQTEIPQLELLQEQMNDPNFFSGAGEKYNLLYKRLKSAVGMDPDAAVPQEILRKVTASNVLSSLGALKGLGPIRVAEMNMAREAAASPDNSIPANKMLVEISKRTHQRNAEIADMAQTYKDQNGALDPAFDKKVSQYYTSHPLFSDSEIKDWHRIIGEQPKTASTPAAQPAQMPTFASPAAVHAANLPSGTQFKDANGVTRVVP